MEIIVIYKTRTGFTKRYAQWIHEDIGCEMVSYDDLHTIDLLNYKLVIYGGRVHAGKIDSLEKVKKLCNQHGNDLFVFATGATPAAATEEIKKLAKNNFADGSIPFFYAQSGLCYEKMGLVDKAIMKSLASMLSSKDKKSNVEHGTAQAIRESYDICDKCYIAPLLDFVKEKYKTII